jgi:hypothetical protein
MPVTFGRTLTLTSARFDRSRRRVTQRATAARSRAYFFELGAVYDDQSRSGPADADGWC